jgi:hypothetical protein
MNIDIAPTMLDAAGIVSPVAMDGVSMHDLVTGEQDRKELFYEYYNKEECTPTMHAVRTFDHIYINNSCDNVTEEFYDLVNDSLENQNQINNPSLQALIQTYRDKLDSLRIFYGDTVWTDTIVPCQLISYATDVEDVDAPGTLKLSISPNPGNGSTLISWTPTPSDEVMITVSDMTGRTLLSRYYSNTSSRTDVFHLQNFPDGIYFINAKSGNEERTLKYVKQE